MPGEGQGPDADPSEPPVVVATARRWRHGSEQKGIQVYAHNANGRPADANIEAILDYVVEHEVCHLEVMDHSPRFWLLLESRVPDWREHAAWLRRYGSTLVLKSLRTSHQYYQVCHIMLLIIPCAEVCSNEELHHFSYDQTFN